MIHTSGKLITCLVLLAAGMSTASAGTFFIAAESETPFITQVDPNTANEGSAFFVTDPAKL